PRKAAGIWLQEGFYAAYLVGGSSAIRLTAGGPMAYLERMVSHLALGRFLLCAFATGLPTIASAGTVLPSFSPADFSPGAAINNPYFPLPPGTTSRETATVTDPDTGQKGF